MLNFVFVEPGYYEEGAFGIRIESMMEVVAANTPFAFEGKTFYKLVPLTFVSFIWVFALNYSRLMEVPMDLNLINPTLLSIEEKAWINNYHEDCRREILPLLTEDFAQVSDLFKFYVISLRFRCRR